MKIWNLRDCFWCTVEYKYLAPGLLLFVDKLLCSETENLFHTIVGTLFGPMESHPKIETIIFLKNPETLKIHSSLIGYI